jgi:ketosteroid isomerase-like protein
VQALAALYADDAVLRAPEGGVPRAGRADIKGYLRRLFADAGDARIELVSVSTTSGDGGALVEARWTLTGRQRVRLVSRAVLRRGPGGAWQILESTWSLDPADASARELGDPCVRDVDCKALALCVEGRCAL